MDSRWGGYFNSLLTPLRPLASATDRNRAPGFPGHSVGCPAPPSRHQGSWTGWSQRATVRAACVRSAAGCTVTWRTSPPPRWTHICVRRSALWRGTSSWSTAPGVQK
eukprot:gene19931-biopygen17544